MAAMNLGCASLTLVSAILCTASGCTNAAGERTTLWEWWRGRDAANSSNDAPRNPRSSADDNAVRDSAPAPAADAPAGGSPDDGGDPPPSAIRPDALIVNNQTITVGDVLEPILPTVEKMAAELPPKTYYDRVADLVRRQIIEAVAEQLIWRRAQEKIKEEVDSQIGKVVDKMEKDRINREFGGSETKYEKYLAQRGKSRADVRQRLRRSIIIESYLREHLLPLVSAPRKPDLLRYYEGHRDEFSRPARREMFLIDVPAAAFLDRGRPATDTEQQSALRQARKTVEEAAEALKAGRPFEDVAKQHSRGLNQEQGGAWGFIGAPLQGRWAMPSQRLFEMQAGEVSGIIETPDGFFIVKVGQVEGGDVVSFQDAQPEIIDRLRQERFTRLRADFLQKELEQSSLSSLDAFVTEVLKALPKPAGK
jgi:peptidyl-prolyl cis-trans isomerase SurA